MNTKTNGINSDQENANPQQTTPPQTAHLSAAPLAGKSKSHTMTPQQNIQPTFTPQGLTPMERWQNESLREGHWNDIVLLAPKPALKNKRRYGDR